MNKGLVVLLTVIGLGLLGLAIGPSERMQKKYPRDGLTDSQLVKITDDCVQHPDALSCR